MNKPAKPKAIFVAATGQNVGKTTLSLGLFAALQKSYSSVGFIKPVGQYHVQVDEETRVDKDAVLFKEHFQLKNTWPHISPVIIPSGFTREFLDKKVTEDSLLKSIKVAFQAVTKDHEYTLVEGTGHIGVGSIIHLNNARVAAELGLDMVIIASAGLGSAYDELALNIAMCERYGVKIKGIILNRVLDEKREMMLEYFPKTLAKWNIPLIGCVPYNEMLSYPTIRDFEALFKTSMLSGHEHHHPISHIRLVAGSLEAYEAELTENELIITPASRTEIVLKTLERFQKGIKRPCGIILTSPVPPTKDLLKALHQSNIPSLYAPICSYDAMKMISSFTTKIRTEDKSKIAQAIKLVDQHVDLSVLKQ